MENYFKIYVIHDEAFHVNINGDGISNVAVGWSLIAGICRNNKILYESDFFHNYENKYLKINSDDYQIIIEEEKPIMALQTNRLMDVE